MGCTTSGWLGRLKRNAPTGAGHARDKRAERFIWVSYERRACVSTCLWIEYYIVTARRVERRELFVQRATSGEVDR